MEILLTRYGMLTANTHGITRSVDLKDNSDIRTGILCLIRPNTSFTSPLKVPVTPSKSSELDKDKTPVAHKQGLSKQGTIAAKDISSPHELTAFVETLLEQLDAKFDEASGQILERMNQMSTRVDALESSIQDIINGDISVPASPGPTTPNTIRRTDSGGH